LFGVNTLIRSVFAEEHDPGSARAVQHALAEHSPDIVLIEGPPEADALASLVNDPDMRPPVTLLGYSPEHPQRAVFYPFASFSPEWVALRWADEMQVPVRFIDLALTHTLATDANAALAAPRQFGLERPVDPLGELAAAAGYDDTERWWEDVVELRDGASPFGAIADAMSSLRQACEPGGEPIDPVEQRREAQMRSGIRKAVKDGFERIAVVCGAWHVPALDSAMDPKRARADASLLRGMAKTKAAITWVPWSHRRLSSTMGYGAGVTAPGWYHHLFTFPGPDTTARWFTEAARALRRADFAASPADVVEATRLGVALAALRGRPQPGLVEVSDSAKAVLGDGTDTPMQVIHNELVIGTLIGRVPERTPMVPLARDLAIQQKKCRLKTQGIGHQLELDLRKETDLRRSHLLYRLSTLGVHWGRLVDGRRSAGTFRETWQMQWEPELELRLIESSALGTTVESAAVNALAESAQGASSLATLTGLIELCLLADLPESLPGAVQLLAQRATLQLDVANLMDALPALARTVRYGDVRGTDAESLRAVIQSVTVRISAGLTPACTGLDDEAARSILQRLADTASALSLIGETDSIAMFHDALAVIVEHPRVHGLVQGRATRLLTDCGALAPTQTELRLSRALSIGTPPTDGANFVEGFLAGAGTILIYDRELLGVIDRWLATLDADTFTSVLPLLRRTFAVFESAERRQIGERVRHDAANVEDSGFEMLDPERVAAALQTIGSLLGVMS
jgi:Family of unknown function (DUF5682)